MRKQNIRSIASIVIENVVEHGQSLNNILPSLRKKISNKDKALLQKLCFGVLRTLSQMEWFINKLMSRQMTGKQRTIHYLIMVGFYQLLYTRIPPYAILAESVEGAAVINPKLKKLINGILRQFQRQQDKLLAEFSQSESRFLHPEWLLKRLKQAYPKDWERILEANNQHPPMWVRVNRNYCSCEEWIALLKEIGIKGYTHQDYPNAVRLASPTKVHILPGFKQGWFTVQDLSAQGCITYLSPRNGERILDLCAAPGGKTTHILEVAPKAKVLAIDLNKQRLLQLYDNLKRLGLKVEVKHGDGRTPSKWCRNERFDRILVDVPCSATGVIRRHPDIKWLRRDCDIDNLVQVQAQILDAIWPYLKSNGTLVYSTCSILPEENTLQIKAFLKRTFDAIISETGNSCKPGKQILPSIKGCDGFFYAKLIKL